MSVRCQQATISGTLCQQRWHIPITIPGKSYPEFSTPTHIMQNAGAPGPSKLLPPFYTQMCQQTLAPLNALLKSTSTNSRSLQWNSDATSSFHQIKETLAKATLLVHPKPDAPINIMMDASDVAIGAVLQQY